MERNNKPTLVKVKFSDHTMYFILSPKDKRFVPLGEKHLKQAIPNYILLNEQARQKAARAFIKRSDIVKKFRLPGLIPHAPSHRLSHLKGSVAAKVINE